MESNLLMMPTTREFRILFQLSFEFILRNFLETTVSSSSSRSRATKRRRSLSKPIKRVSFLSTYSPRPLVFYRYPSNIPSTTNPLFLLPRFRSGRPKLDTIGFNPLFHNFHRTFSRSLSPPSIFLNALHMCLPLPLLLSSCGLSLPDTQSFLNKLFFLVSLFLCCTF